MHRSLLLALAIALSSATSAQARPLDRPPLPSPMPLIVAGTCPADPDAGGCYYSATHTLYHRGGNRFALAHELGHAFDTVELDERERTRFAGLMGQGGATQWLSTSEHARDSLSEIFADAYATCRLGMTATGRWTTSTTYSPSPEQQRRVCRFITAAVDY